MLKVFTQHRYLLWQFTKRLIEQRHRGSSLGMIWSVLQPLMMMAIYTVVFKLVFKGRYSGGSEEQSTSDYALAMFLSITIFQTIGEIIGSSTGIIVGQPNLVKKVVFPLEILPIANLASTLYQFLISLFLTIIGVVTVGNGITPHSLQFLITLLPLIPLGLGLAMLLSSLGVFLRDIQYAAGPATMILMYTSAVFYSAEMLPPYLLAWLRYNPLLQVIEQARAVLMWNHPVDWGAFAYSLTVGFIVLGIGLYVFRKLKPAFADVL